MVILLISLYFLILLTNSLLLGIFVFGLLFFELTQLRKIANYKIRNQINAFSISTNIAFQSYLDNVHQYAFNTLTSKI